MEKRMRVEKKDKKPINIPEILLQDGWQEIDKDSNEMPFYALPLSGSFDEGHERTVVQPLEGRNDFWKEGKEKPPEGTCKYGILFRVEDRKWKHADVELFE